MSKQFVQLFFPTFSSLVSSPDLSPSFLVHAWNEIFPDDVSKLCSVPLPNDTTTTVLNAIIMPHRPCLAAAAITGAIIGMKSDAVVLNNAKFYPEIASCARRESILSIHIAWSKSRTAFGFMNVVAMILHCVIPQLLEQKTIIAVAVTNFLWAADCILTGIACINLIHVALLVYSIDENKEHAAIVTILKQSRRRTSIIIHASMLVIIASLSLLNQFLQTGHIHSLASAASTFFEMMYIVPLIAATLFLFPAVFRSAFDSRGTRNSILGSRIAIFGGTVVVAGVSLEKSLCYFITEHAPWIKTNQLLYDVYHMPTLLFCGCDISFGGLNMWVNSLVSCALLEPKTKVI